MGLISCKGSLVENMFTLKVHETLELRRKVQRPFKIKKW